MSDPIITVKKHSSFIPVARELLRVVGMIEPTPEERAKAEKAAVEAKRHAAARAEQVEAARQQLASLDDPLARAILDLHHEEHGECVGDDFDGREAEPPYWPCRTVATIAKHHGIVLESEYA